MAAMQESGVDGLAVAPGDHICALYLGVPERDEILLPYLREGLRAGEKCIAVVDTTTPQEVLQGIGDEIDVEGWVASEQLDVRSAEDAYLRFGRFATEDMLAFWDTYMETALGGGRFRFVRVAGETTWALRHPPDVDELIRYESALNQFTSRYPQCVLCMYDLNHFGGGILVDLLRTHPRLLLGGMLLENPHYVQPEEFLAVRS
jgi:hypothetical protein